MSPAHSSAESLAIVASRVEKQFPAGEERVPVLRGLDVSLRLGEMVMLVGPSGCGKTTLLSILCGTLRSDAGEITVLGRRLESMSDAERTRFRGEHMGFIFQQFNLVPRLTALENVGIPLTLQGRSRSEVKSRSAEVLMSVGLGDRLEAFPRELSGGQQQRVAIARALVHGPAILLADEPTAALDAAAGRSVMELLKSMSARPDRAVIIVTHDQRIYPYADRIIAMEDGLIKASPP